MDRSDRTAIEDLDRVLRVTSDLRRLYPVAVRMANDVSIKSTIEGPSTRSGSSHADPTANAALDGRRQRRRSSVRKARKAIGAALRHLQEAHYHSLQAAED